MPRQPAPCRHVSYGAWIKRGKPKKLPWMKLLYLRAKMNQQLSRTHITGVPLICIRVCLWLFHVNVAYTDCTVIEPPLYK